MKNEPVDSPADHLKATRTWQMVHRDKCFQQQRHRLHRQQELMVAESGRREGCYYTLDFRMRHCCSFMDQSAEP